MKDLIIAILIISLAIIGLTSVARGELVTEEEALTTANNWITVVIHIEGSWGKYESAQVETIEEFKREDRVIGYFCKVKPRGYITISLLKELAPVKAYSAFCDLDPESTEGMTDLIKGGMERILDAIEQRIGPIKAVRFEDLDSILEINYIQAWRELAGNVDAFKENLASGNLKINYQESEILLSSSWHQGPPYNDQCPDMGCSWPPCYYNTNAPVGCVATAGAQIMNYWKWPPYGEGSPYNNSYDWPNMPDSFLGCTWPQGDVDAVAELNHEVGIAVSMVYSCAGSGTYTHLMEGVFENHYRYSSTCSRRNRPDYTAVEWFNRMKTQFNLNRPIQYRIPGHSIVSDGWQEIGSTPVRQYHMNYGWAESHNAWYTLDALYAGNPSDEYMLENIYPALSLGPTLSGVYSLQPFIYRYFDQDAIGDSATFAAGQYHQFLPNIVVTCTSTQGGSIRFEGSNANNSVLFTKGEEHTGVRIYEGTLKLNENGCLEFH